MTQRDVEELEFPPDRVRRQDDAASRYVISELPEEQGLTWPSAVWPSQGGYQASQPGLLTLNALLAPDLPRPRSANAFTNWPGWTHVWPGAAITAWSGLGFWAHTEPLHALMAAGFGVAGTVFMGLGAFGTMASNLIARDSDSEPADRSGTRTLLGIGAAAFSGAASTGAGLSGIGCMLAAGSAAAVYGGKWAWQQYARHRAIRAVIDFAAASNPGPIPPGMPLPTPPIALPDNRLPSNPYEHRLSQALSAMRIEGTWFGSPMKVAEDTWRLPFELPQGANLSPEALAKKAHVIANNARARRIEIEPTHGARGTITVYDGPDRTDEDYPWDGAMATTVEKPFPVAKDEAGRTTKRDINEHEVITGKTRSGKSAYLRLLLTSTLACPIVRIGIDCKDGAPGLGMFEPVMYRLATDPYDGLRIQYGIKAISSARSIRMRERGIDKWDLADGPRIVVFIDEQAELSLRYPQYAGPILKSNLALVAASAITYELATQTPSGPVFGANTDARHQFGYRTGFHNDKEVSRMMFGSSAERDGWRVDRLDGVGKFLMSSFEHTKPHVHKALWVDRDTAVRLVEQYADQIEDLDAMSAEAFHAGMAAFDDAIEAGQDPLETFEPPPSGGGGHRTGRVIHSAQTEGRRPDLRLLPTVYPDKTPMPENRQVLWNAISKLEDGFTYRDVVALGLPGYARRSSVQDPLDQWRARGWVEEIDRRGNTTVFKLTAKTTPLRKDA